MCSSEITIRNVELADIENLRNIGRQTFIEAFSDDNTQSNLESYLSESFNINRLGLEIKESNSEFYFAEIDKFILGYLKLNKGNAQTEEISAKAIEIERIYVLRDYYGKQVGQLLYNQALNIAQSSLADFLWLGVWENNPRAIRFYEKNGFVKFGQHSFMLGEEEQIDILMKLKIAPSDCF